MNRPAVERLLAPRTVAFVGGRVLEPAIENCRSLGFGGQMWVVNPTRDRIGGLPCVPSVADLPAAPDAAFVGVGRDHCIEVVRELAAHGAGGCVCLAGGFAEIGGDGRTRQDRLVAAAGDIALMGPNCYGYLNYADGVALWPDVYGGSAPVGAGAAFVSQSGNLALNATTADRSLALTHVLSIGNQAVTAFGAYLDVLARDPRVQAIGLYVEDILDVDAFGAAVRRASQQRVPVVALPGGVSPVGSGVVGRHTGARGVGDLREMLPEIDVATVDSLASLLETLKLLTCWRDGGGLGACGTEPKLAAVAASGGDVAVLADLAELKGLVFPTFDAATARALEEPLGGLVSVANPLDYGTAVWGRLDALTDVFTTLMRAHLDAVVLVIDYPRTSATDVVAWDATVEAFVAAHTRTGRRAAVVSALPEGLPESVRRRLLAAGVAPLQGLAEAVTALGVAARLGWSTTGGSTGGRRHVAR